MTAELKVPSVGESITEVTIGKLLKQSGDLVRVDEEIIEIETDKLNQVLYAPITGTVQFLVKTGDVVKIGQVIATFTASKEAPPQEMKKVEAPPPQQPQVKKEEPKPQEGAIRISKEEWLTAPSTKKEAVSQPRTSTDRESRQKMSKIRKVIAARMLQATHDTAMLTTFNEVDMSAVMGIREKYKELFQKKYNVKLGLMSFFVKAVADALTTFPIVNSYIDGDDLVTRHYIDIGIAVSTDRGVVVPVLRDADKLSYDGIEKNIEDFAARARNGTLTVDELRGGGFTITNGGVFGSLLSTPILNPPQCAILGMHKIVKRPVAIDDQIGIRPMMYLALSYDHRLIDGKEAVTFLIHIKNHLEDPERAILHI